MSGLAREAHGGQVWNADGRRALRLDFSANVWPERGIRFPKNLRALIEPYPDPDCTVLRRAASRMYGIPPECLLAVNGATEGLYLVMQALRPRRLAVYTPAFSEYERAARRGGNDTPVEMVYVPTEPARNFVPQLEVPRADVVVFGNPNNPTGTLLTTQQLAPWLDDCDRTGVWTVVDEAFLEFVREPERHSLLAELTRWPRLIVLRSMTKRYGVAGLRLGFVAAAAETILRLREIHLPWAVSTLAQQVGLALAERPPDPGFAERIANERKYLTRGLQRLGYRVFPGTANFLLFQMPAPLGNAKLLAFLRARDIGLRDAGNFRGLDATYLRCAVRPRAEARQLLQTMEEYPS